MTRRPQILIGAVLGACAGALLWRYRGEVDWGGFPSYLSAAGVVIAALGLSTWRRQMAGTHDFELARRTLKATFQLRDSVQAVRHPFMSLSEAADRPADSDQPWESFAYQARWDRVADADQDLSVALLEIEVVWGSLIKAECAALRAHIGTLNSTVRKFLRTRDERPRQQSGESLSQEDDAILYWIGDDDEFTTKLHQLVRAVEVKVAPKLGR